MTYWIFSVTPENWQIAREQKIWAIRTENLAQKVKKGDFIVLYVSGTESFCTIIEILEDWHTAKQPVWPDEIEENRIKYPYQTKVKIVQEGLANIKKMLQKLSFIKNKQKWGVYVQGTPANMRKSISELDYQSIQDAMKSNTLPQDITTLLKVKRKTIRRTPLEEKAPTLVPTGQSQLEERDKKIWELQKTLQEKEDRIRQLEAQIGPSPLGVIIQKLGNTSELSPEDFEWTLKRAFEELGFDAKWNGELKNDMPQQTAPQGKPDVEVRAPLAGDPYYMVVEATKVEEERYQVTEVHGAVDHSHGFPGLPYKTCYRLVIAPRFRKGAIEACNTMDPQYPVMLLTSQDFMEILKFHSEVGGITQEELKHLLDELDGKGEIRREHIEGWEKTVREQRKKLSLALTVYDILYSDKEFMWPRDIWRELKKQRNEEGLPCESLQDVHDVLKILDTIGALVVKADPVEGVTTYKAGLTPEGFRLRIRKLEETVRLQESKQPTRTDKISSWMNR